MANGCIDFTGSAEDLAKRIYEAYQLLAPRFRYDTLPTWEGMDERDRDCLLAVCAYLLFGDEG
jgi:hypothetical protein